jgi:hypothetical protein
MLVRVQHEISQPKARDGSRRTLAMVEPRLNITADCTDPYFRPESFVETGRQDLTFTAANGAVIPYREITGFFPARDTATNPLPAGVTISPTLSQQNYIFRFPLTGFRNRSMQGQHPTTPNTIVSNQLAFTNGALSVNHINAGNANAPGHFRHHAAATKLAESFAQQIYGNTGKIFSYYWGCSGGGQMAQGAAEGQIGVWDGIQVQCPSTRGNPTHSMQWPGHLVLALPEAQRQRIANLRLVGNGVNGTDGFTEAEKALLYEGLNEEQRFVLNEVLSAGFPLNEFVNFTGTQAIARLTPQTGTNDIIRLDPTYESDFWDSGIPGYAGTNPPAYLQAALMDGFATVTGINRDGSGAITSIQLDPSTIPPVPTNSPIGTVGQRFYVYAADGVTRTTDPNASNANAFAGLSGTLDRTTGLLTISGTNSQVLLDAVMVGGKIRVNNRFMLAAYYYPRHTIVPGYFQYDQYRAADGTPLYPQRPFNVADVATVRQTAGNLESGNITTKVMIFHNLSDNQAFPLWSAGYLNVIRQALGAERANANVRLYFQERGGHSAGGVVAGIFNQSLIDMIAWVEQGIAPPPSSRFTIELGQIVLAPQAAGRLGLQPVINLSANGNVDRATVGVNQPVNLAAKLQMPPTTGKITQFSWAVNGATEAATVLPTPQPLVNVTRTFTFATPGNYIIRLNVNGQRNGIAAPADQTLAQNFKEIRVVVQ